MNLIINLSKHLFASNRGNEKDGYQNSKSSFVKLIDYSIYTFNFEGISVVKILDMDINFQNINLLKNSFFAK